MRNSGVSRSLQLAFLLASDLVVEFVAAPRMDSLHPDLQRFTGIIPRDTDARAEYHDAMRAKHA